MTFRSVAAPAHLPGAPPPGLNLHHHPYVMGVVNGYSALLLCRLYICFSAAESGHKVTVIYTRSCFLNQVRDYFAA